MPSDERFEKLIGQIVSSCGTLEVLTNSLIHALGKDPVLTGEVTSLIFSRRIRILRQLLPRTSLSHDEIEAVCNELLLVCNERNVIAHNPIYHQDDALYVGVMTGLYGDPNRKRLNEADLEKVLERAEHAARNLMAISIGKKPV